MSRLPSQKVISVSLPQALLDDIDRRATAMGLSRSAYLSLLAQQDLTKGGPLPVPAAEAPQPPENPEPAKPLDLTTAAYEFLIQAIPALEEYDRQLKKLPPSGDVPEPPEELAETTLWQFFLLEREEILRYKWLQSEQEQRDIGLSRAVQEWLQNHHALWAAAHPPTSDR